MKYEEWIKYKEEDERKWVAQYGPWPLSYEQKIDAMRKELDSLKGRLKDEVLEELRTEIERMIATSRQSILERSISHDLSE